MQSNYQFLEFRNGNGIPYIRGTRIKASVIGIDFEVCTTKDSKDYF